MSQDEDLTLLKGHLLDVNFQTAGFGNFTSGFKAAVLLVDAG